MSARTKVCIKCQTKRPTTEFYFKRHTRDGLSVYCKPCSRAYAHERYWERKDGHHKRRPKSKFGRKLHDLPKCLSELEPPGHYGALDIKAMHAERPYRLMMEVLEAAYWNNQRRTAA